MYQEEFNEDKIVPFIERTEDKMKNLDTVDDRFIYLTGGGLKQLINVVVQLHADPQKRALVNLDFNDTVEFIVKKIGESMERFDVYKGLLGLRAINLAKKTARAKLEALHLESVGTARAKSLFSDQDMLCCDIHSAQVWVELKIALQSPIKRYKVHLFVKVARGLQVARFQSILQKLVIKLWVTACSPEQNKLLYVLKDLAMRLERTGGTLAHLEASRRNGPSEQMLGRKGSAIVGPSQISVDPKQVSAQEQRLWERGEGIVEQFFNFEGALRVLVNFNTLEDELVVSPVREQRDSGGLPPLKRRLTTQPPKRPGTASPMRGLYGNRPKKHVSRQQDFKRGGSQKLSPANRNASAHLDESIDGMARMPESGRVITGLVETGILSDGNLSYDGDHEMMNNSGSSHATGGAAPYQQQVNNNDFRGVAEDAMVNNNNNSRPSLKTVPLSPRDFDQREESFAFIDPTSANLRLGCIIVRNRDFNEQALALHRRLSRYTQRRSQLQQSPFVSSPSRESSSSLSDNPRLRLNPNQPHSLQPDHLRLVSDGPRLANQRTFGHVATTEGSDEGYFLKTEPAQASQTPGQAVLQLNTMSSMMSPLPRQVTFQQQGEPILEAPHEQDLQDGGRVVGSLESGRRLTEGPRISEVRKRSIRASIRGRAGMKRGSIGQHRRQRSEKSELSMLGNVVEHGYINDEVAEMELQLHRNQLINRVKVADWVLSYQELQEIEIPTIRDIRFEGAELLDKDTSFLIENQSESRTQNALLRRCSRPVCITFAVSAILIVLILVIVLCVLYA